MHDHPFALADAGQHLGGEAGALAEIDAARLTHCPAVFRDSSSCGAIAMRCCSEHW